MFAGVLPFDGMQGEAALLAGVLAKLIDQLARLKQIVAAERTLADWHAVLQDLLQRFFEPASEDEHVWRQLQQCLDRLLQIQKHADFDGPVVFDMLLEALDKELERSRHPAGFFIGAVTFAEMQPMRGIPFRVICLIGMNDHAFPRQTFLPGFNLISQSSRKGDRDQAKDDRYVFLEALLAARDVLYISYTGQSQQDNASLPPSVLVSELLDALEATNRAEGSDLKEHVFFKHYLQPFNAKYFIPEIKEQSYSEQHLACAQAFQDGSTNEPDFFETALPEPQEAEVALSLDELVRFFKNPSAYLLRERLNVSLEPQVFSITERESFQLGGLERYGVEQTLLQELLANPDAEGSFEHCAARGILPHGVAGHAVYLQSLQSVKKFVSDLNRSAVIPEGTESRLLEIDFDDCTLSASVSLAADASLVRMRHAAIKPIDFIRVWLEYLIVCSAPDIGNPSAVLAGLDQKKREQTRLWDFNSVDDPRTELKNIIDLYHEGLRSPLAFMPQASFAYAEALNAGKSPQQARIAAVKSLEHGDFKNSELDDVCFGRFFNESIVESPDFERCAREVFGPIFQHRQKKM
jgi:exodeoxyribonuclease V gamma subunit